MSKLLSLLHVVAYATTRGIDLEFYAVEALMEKDIVDAPLRAMKVRARDRRAGTFADLMIYEKVLIEAVVPDTAVASLVLNLVKRLDEIEVKK